ncbi:hypothetical protein M9980_02260 [Sphingomonas donggukensis]|uniref:Uncharacterized protein n=1 Tax=Sphingomonas donggukensis TaxID=2949093 RepID=A0ABY4TX40_9SPHN|nr:hypothetical protein [Sphingomonas donggukensis]URW76077.1 hypothetical protein M9980_02260 [Sphingomonas donggukensis]
MKIARFLPPAALALTLPAAAGGQRTPPPVAPTVGSSTVIIQQRMIIRVPRLPGGRTPVAAAAARSPFAAQWTEKKADRCVPVTRLAAAAINGPDSVDLMLNGGQRLRAKLGDECPALDFYSGFYVQMAKDGKVCARRDSIRSRSGRECRIEWFRTLVPAR